MKNLFYMLLIIGTAFTTACSTNSTNEKPDEPAAAEAPANTTSTDTAPAAEATATETPAVQNESSSTTNDSSSSTNYGNDIVYTCTHGDNVRTIRVLYHEEGPTVCEVTYEKSTGTQSLWSANNDESYCADKAAGFVAKQQDWGWDCNK